MKVRFISELVLQYYLDAFPISGPEACTYDVLSLARELSVVLAEVKSRSDAQAEICQVKVGKSFQSLWMQGNKKGKRIYHQIFIRLNKLKYVI